MELVKAPPKSQQLAGFLREKIVSGNLAVGSRLMTSRELAGKFSVSKQVVQSAFSQLEKEKLITTHVGRGTYVAEPKTSIKSAGLIIPGLSDEHNILPLVLQAHLQKLKYQVNIYDMDTLAMHRDILTEYLKSEPDVMIMDIYSEFPADIYSTLPLSIRKIFVNRFEQQKRPAKASYILLDYHKMGYLCVKQLMKIGCSRIALIAFKRTPGWTCDLFTSGCEKALAENGALLAGFIDFISFSHSDYHDLLTSSEPPDGFVAMDAFRVLPLIKMLAEDHMKTKRNIPIIAGSNTPWSEAYNLTSIDRNEDKIPIEIERVLKSDENVDIKIEPELIFRRSCPKNG